jgi:hypothetical protein
VRQFQIGAAGSIGRCKTPSSALIRQCFCGSAIGLAVLGQNSAREAFRLVSPLRAILASGIRGDGTKADELDGFHQNVLIASRYR